MKETIEIKGEKWTTVLQAPVTEIPRYDGMSLDTHLILEHSSHLAADYATTVVIMKDFVLLHNTKQCLVFHRIQEGMKDYRGEEELQLIFEHSSQE